MISIATFSFGIQGDLNVKMHLLFILQHIRGVLSIKFYLG